MLLFREMEGFILACIVGFQMKKVQKSKNYFDNRQHFYTMPMLSYRERFAGVAQWLESLPSKQAVVGSSPIARSISFDIDSKEVQAVRYNHHVCPLPSAPFPLCGRIAQLVRAQHW